MYYSGGKRYFPSRKMSILGNNAFAKSTCMAELVPFFKQKFMVKLPH